MNELTDYRPQELSDEQKLSSLAAEIRALTASALSTIVEIGRRMCAAKEMVKHGEWGAWLQENTGYSSSTAENFMRIFREYGADQMSLFGNVENSQTFGNLTYSKALALLSVPKSEREEFAQEHDVEAMSTRELQEAIRERDQALRDAEDAQRRNALQQEKLNELRDKLREAEEWQQQSDKDDEDNRKLIEELRTRINELEHRPVEVAVERDEQAIKEAAAEAKAKAEQEAEKKLKEAQDALGQKTAQAEKLEKDLAEAMKKLEEAEAAPKEDAEKDALREQVAQLEKKLKTSDAAATKVKLLLSQFQAAYRALDEAIGAVEDAEAAARMRAAVQAQIEAWRENNA